MFNPQLTAFLCAADCGSFNKAADQLYISPTAVMKQINGLEKHLGLALVKRTNQGIELTRAGESIYRDARYMIAYSEQAIQKSPAAYDGGTAGSARRHLHAQSM